MGLDMYLSARKYIGNWDHSDDKEKQAYKTILRESGVEGLTAPCWSPHLFVEVCVAYWRKANAIHRWFVTHCQDGEDNCQPHSVGREQLEELCKECETILAKRDSAAGKKRAREKLPPASGFFFGGTEMDDDYWYTIGDTVSQIRGILENKSLEGFEFTYRSSW